MPMPKRRRVTRSWGHYDRDERLRAVTNFIDGTHRLCQSRPNHGYQTENRREEDGATATNEIVQGIRHPAAEKRGSNVRTRVDQPDDPLVVLQMGRVRLSLGRRVRHAKLFGPRQVGAVAAGLVPSLHGGGNGAEDDREVHSTWLTPFVHHLVRERLALLAGQVGDAVEIGGVLGDEGALAQERGDVIQIILGSKLIDLGQQQVGGDTD